MEASVQPSVRYRAVEAYENGRRSRRRALRNSIPLSCIAEIFKIEGRDTHVRP